MTAPMPIPAFAPVLRSCDGLDACVAVCDELVDGLVCVTIKEEEEEAKRMEDVAGPVTTAVPIVYVADKSTGAKALNFSVVGELQLTEPSS